MLKKILIGFGIFILLVAGALAYLNNRNRTLSPPGEAELTVGDFAVRVEYSRPSVRGRLVFGTEAEGALQPYGKYWRLGANEPTKLIVNKDFQFEGKAVAAGTYDMYAVPGANSFIINLNKDDRFWGYTEPDYLNDVVSVSVPVTKSEIGVEQFTITIIEEEGAAKLVFMWANNVWSVRVTE